MAARKIIIDTDPGQDDAVAILLALASPELEVLGLTCVAEGLETEDQLAFLGVNRCQEVQGYLIARPMPAADFERWVPPRWHAAQLESLSA